MNAHAFPTRFPSLMRRNLVSLVLTQKHFAHERKRMALEAEQAGKQDEYRRHRAESDRLWQSAKWHLDYARRW